MSLEFYSKDPPTTFYLKKRGKDRYFFAFISLVGLASFIFAAWPFLIWQISTLPKLSSNIDDAPIPQSRVLSAATAVPTNVQVVQDPDGFSYFTTLYRPEGERPEKFSISIPKLEIDGAIVKVDDLNFKKNLSHFPGSALPGEVGNSFVTGHSVLPQFNDPKDYDKIFTKLSDLEIGDKIYVEIEGKQLQYIVQYSKVVNPRDLSVLSPISQNAKNLTLMTCVPPGTNIKRLVVITSLI